MEEDAPTESDEEDAPTESDEEEVLDPIGHSKVDLLVCPGGDLTTA